jgi:type I restriction enzyme R subunit
VAVAATFAIHPGYTKISIVMVKELTELVSFVEHSLLNDEIKQRSSNNIVQSRKFSEMLAAAIKRYQNNALTAAEIIRLAKTIKEADRRGENLNLDFRELAFYDALEVNDSAVQILGDESATE